MKEKSISEKVNIIITNIIRLFILATIIKSIVINDYSQMLILIVTFILTFYNIVVEKLLKLKLPVYMRLLITLFIFCAQYLGTIKDWYGKFWWWDTALHTVSGGIFTMLGIIIIKEINKRTNNVNISPIIIILFGFCFSLAIGVIWELFEFSIDKFFGGNMQRTVGETGQAAIMDTMVDLFSATVGSIIISIIKFINHFNTKINSVNKNI